MKNELKDFMKAILQMMAIVVGMFGLLFIVVLGYDMATTPPAPIAQTAQISIVSEPEVETIVYTTRTGECYHMDYCDSLSHSKYETTLEQAIADGYRPCQNCEPPTE